MSVHVGTSGWHYKDWVGPFYPEDLRTGEMLGYYSREFATVEINSSFYRLPEAETLAAWRDATPQRFVFAFKANRYITHMKKLHDVKDALGGMLAAARLLGEKLGPILFQLPPRWRANAERLRQFLELLPGDLPTAFEFRDPSWFADEVYETLRAHRVGFCIYDLAGTRAPREVTSDLVYIRLHGPGGAYKGSYSDKDLSGWAGAVSAWDRSGRDVYCFFDNDERAFAALNAGRLRDMLKP